MHTRRSVLVLFAAVAVGGLIAPAALADSKEMLFFIQRSKNAAEVHYDACLTADGTLDAKKPVQGYWFNRQPDGSIKTDGLTFLQKMAYGYEAEPAGNGTYVFKMQAFKDRAMSLVRVKGHWVVQTTIAGKQAHMKRLYVATDESGVMPKVLYVDVFGEDATTGAALTEHIVKN